MNESSRVPPPVVQELLPVVGASRFARDVVTEACVTWDLPHLIPPATLIVSELVGNVVDHAGTMMTLHVVRQPDFLYIGVRDGSSVPPVLRNGSGVPTGRGRGLLLIEAVSASWGYRSDEDGKTVWATMDLTPVPDDDGLERDGPG